MFKRILLPLDGSELAEITLPYGEELARRLGSEVILLHVRGQERQQEYEHIHQVYLDRLAETVKANINSGQPKAKQVKVTTKVESGEPSESICRLVDENDVDLIIMTAVSTSGLKIGKMLGSVTDHVCRTVPKPVMLIRPPGAKQTKGKEHLINHILITLDGSELSKLALPVAEELASKLKVSATLFRMANMIRLYDDGSESGTFIDYTKLNETEKKRVDAEMIILEREIKKKGIDVNHVVTSGFDAAEDIIETAKKAAADLMVMSTHGRSGLSRWAFGSVAEKILRQGEIPLVLVNAKAG
ncbi:MAG: universal stress protein [Chloroflexota bacterium]